MICRWIEHWDVFGQGQATKLKNHENSKNNQKPEVLKVNQKIKKYSKNNQKPEFFKLNQKIKKYSKTFQKYGVPPYFRIFFEYFLMFWFTLKNSDFCFFLLSSAYARCRDLSNFPLLSKKMRKITQKLSKFHRKSGQKRRKFARKSKKNLKNAMQRQESLRIKKKRRVKKNKTLPRVKGRDPPLPIRENY